MDTMSAEYELLRLTIQAQIEATQAHTQALSALNNKLTKLIDIHEANEEKERRAASRERFFFIMIAFLIMAIVALVGVKINGVPIPGT